MVMANRIDICNMQLHVVIGHRCFLVVERRILNHSNIEMALNVMWIATVVSTSTGRKQALGWNTRMYIYIHMYVCMQYLFSPSIFHTYTYIIVTSSNDLIRFLYLSKITTYILPLCAKYIEYLTRKN